MSNISLIRAHTANGLRFNPQSVDLRDKADLLAEVDRLRLALAEMTADRDRHRAMAEHLTRGKG